MNSRNRFFAACLAVAGSAVADAGAWAQSNRAIEVEERFDAMGYVLEDVMASEVSIPDLTVHRVPDGIGQDLDVEGRKSLFTRVVLPVVLRVNEEVLREREALLEMRSGKRTPAQTRRLHWLAEKYEVPGGSVDALLERVDAIPPSLALAQAAFETGWGQSRFARRGSALYGEWTWSGEGIVPKNRPDGEIYRIKAFDSILESTRSYVENLNTHPAYEELREYRSRARAEGRRPKGVKLANGLDRYAADPDYYISSVKTIIRQNGLGRLDCIKADGFWRVADCD